MRAAVVEVYGGPDVVRVLDVPRPVPRGDEVLVRVHAAAVTSGDARIRGARFPRGFGPFARLAFGVRRPRRHVLGSTFSGVVEVAGEHAPGLSPGDDVCGMTGTRMGAHAEHVAVAARRLTHKPAAVSHEDAAGLLFGGSAALFFLRDKGRVAQGMSVLVNGASGAIGTNAVQLARHFGATVTGVTSGANVGLVRGLGAERVIDHEQEDVTRRAERFDIVLDTVGNVGIGAGRRLLDEGGVLLLAAADLGQTLRARGNVAAGVAPERVADFDLLLALVADGTIEVVHDQAFGLADIAEAHRRVDSGHKVGNVVVRPDR